MITLKLNKREARLFEVLELEDFIGVPSGYSAMWVTVKDLQNLRTALARTAATLDKLRSTVEFAIQKAGAK